MTVPASEDPAQTIQQQVAASIAHGIAPQFDPNLLLQVANNQGWPTANSAVVPVTIAFSSDPLDGLGLYRLASLLPGVPLAQWLPRDGLLQHIVAPDKRIQLQSVGFTLATRAGVPTGIVGFSIGVSLGGGLGALSLDWLPNLSAALTNIYMATNFAGSPPELSVALEGELTLGA